MRYEIGLLQDEMKKEGMTMYVVPSDDYHGSEYVAPYFRCREFLSGFTGSAGTLLVTRDDAMLWTDGRYFLQAEAELEGSGITLMKMGEKGVPSIEEKILQLAEQAGGEAVLGFDGRVVSFEFAQGLRTKKAGNEAQVGIEIKSEFDLTDRIWKDRPAIPCKKVVDFDVKYAGKGCAEKLADVRAAMEAEGADHLFISSLDDIAWLFNLRGSDVPDNPVFLAYAEITAKGARLFADEGRFDEAVRKRLAGDYVAVVPYDDIEKAVRAVPAGDFVWMDRKKCSYMLCSAVHEGVGLIDKTDPTQLMKAVKNPVEMGHIRDSHLRDGVAVTKFVYWLKTNVGREEMTELSVARKLEEFRRQQELYMGESFPAIVGYGPHGAIIHYGATPKSDAALMPRGLCLIDSGGQYLDGTTDITRTVALGPVTDEERRYFTLVLKGHLALSAVRFKKGCTGMAFDYLARRPLWELGEDYNHGTGHGVGFYLGVHEPPNGFRYKKVAERDDGAVLEEGMLTSNEPGYYAAGKFGIRHENLMLCVAAPELGEDFLKFESVTLVPFDRDAIDPDLLSDEEKAILNAYHARVREKLSQHLTNDEREWLRKVTEPV